MNGCSRFAQAMTPGVLTNPGEDAFVGFFGVDDVD
jgi:hypothetical protein